MEHPEEPWRRHGHRVSTQVSMNDLIVTDADGEAVLVDSVDDAEMLIFALQEWIKYKRQLELWERESAL
jgi:hypothetical protein